MNLSDIKSIRRNFLSLVDFSNLINTGLNLDFTLNNLLLTCFGKFFVTKGLIIIIDENNLPEATLVKGFQNSILENFNGKTLNEKTLDADLEEFKKQYRIKISKKIITNSGFKGMLFLGERLTKTPYDKSDLDFLDTILSVASIAIENAQNISKLKKVNRNLDEKVNQLSSLFELSKEFSGILEEEKVKKMVVLSLMGQLMISKYAIVTFHDNKIKIVDNNINQDKLKEVLKNFEPKEINTPVLKEKIEKKYAETVFKLGIELIAPMQIKGENKGLILLGKRTNDTPYSTSDIEFILSVGSLAIISIENSRLLKEAIEKEKIEKDLELAKNIQKKLLPQKLPSLKNYEMFAYNKTARQVGGDYYDVVKLSDENYLFAIGDVSGKGVQAALMMANVQAFLKSICKQKLPLDEATNLINNLVSENTSGGGFITFFWGIVNEKEKTLNYVNAGHNPPLLIRDGKIKKLKTGGMILGVMETLLPYKSEEVELKENDLIVAFTDGITEAMNKDFEEFTDERLEKFIIEKSEFSPEEITLELINEVKLFCKGAEQSDDITTFIIKVK